MCFFAFPYPAARVTKTTDPFSRYTCVMLDYAPFQKYAHYVSVNVPLCIQHIVLDINQIRVISIIIIKYRVCVILL